MNSEVVRENAEIWEAQMADAEIRAILKYKQKGRQPDHVATSIWPEEAKELLLHWSSLVVKEGILYRLCPPLETAPGCMQWILSAALRRKFIETLHVDLGHLGEVKTCNAVARCIYFPGWRPYTELIVQMCGICQKPSRNEQWDPGVESGAAGSPLKAGGEGAIAEMQSQITGLQEAILQAVNRIEWLTCNAVNGGEPSGTTVIKTEAEETFLTETSTVWEASGNESGYRSELEVNSRRTAISDAGQSPTTPAAVNDPHSEGHHASSDGRGQRKSHAHPQSTTGCPPGQDSLPQPNRRESEPKLAEPATYVNVSTDVAEVAESPDSEVDGPISDAESSRQRRRSGRKRRLPARLRTLRAASHAMSVGKDGCHRNLLEKDCNLIAVNRNNSIAIELSKAKSSFVEMGRRRDREREGNLITLITFRESQVKRNTDQTNCHLGIVRNLTFRLVSVLNALNAA